MNGVDAQLELDFMFGCASTLDSRHDRCVRLLPTLNYQALWVT